MEIFLKEINKGLKKETHDAAKIKCFVTYVQDLPNGTERGKFLALDLGGTNFRVLLIHLKGDSDFEMTSKIYAIPQSIMLGHGSQLFDHIAECLANFIKVWYLHENNIFNRPMAITYQIFLGAQITNWKAATRFYILISTPSNGLNKRLSD